MCVRIYVLQLAHLCDLIACIGKGDAVGIGGIIGGDEFAVILTGKDYDNYSKALARLDDACAQDYVIAGENRIPVYLARGVSLFDPAIDTVYRDVFTKADHAMYLHKEESKASLI